MTEENHAIGNAKAWLETIQERVAAIGRAEEAGNNELAEAAREELQEGPLSVMVRDGWYNPGSAHHVEGPTEYEILLTTGGPALRILGELGRYSTPDDDPRLQWQDWGTPWTDYPLDEAERVTVATYARQFYFGE